MTPEGPLYDGGDQDGASTSGRSDAVDHEPFDGCCDERTSGRETTRKHPSDAVDYRRCPTCKTPLYGCIQGWGSCCGLCDPQHLAPNSPVVPSVSTEGDPTCPDCTARLTVTSPTTLGCTRCTWRTDV